MIAVYDEDGYDVEVNENDLDAFIHQWPGCKLHGLLGVTFTFDKWDNLIDVEYRNGNSDDWDGPELLALSQEAQEFAQRSKS